MHKGQACAASSCCAGWWALCMNVYSSILEMAGGKERHFRSLVVVLHHWVYHAGCCFSELTTVWDSNCPNYFSLCYVFLYILYRPSSVCTVITEIVINGTELKSRYACGCGIMNCGSTISTCLVLSALGSVSHHANSLTGVFRSK